jgi:cytoskeletal protein CcmA (bactofilin family)
MQTYHGKKQGPVVFGTDTDFHGRVDGDVVVSGGVTLHFHGMMTGDLSIEPGATVELRGRVHGSVVNKGHLIIYGQVAGSVEDAGGETTAMWPNAILSGRYRH